MYLQKTFGAKDVLQKKICFHSPVAGMERMELSSSSSAGFSSLAVADDPDGIGVVPDDSFDPAVAADDDCGFFPKLRDLMQDINPVDTVKID